MTSSSADRTPNLYRSFTDEVIEPLDRCSLHEAGRVHQRTRLSGIGARARTALWAAGFLASVQGAAGLVDAAIASLAPGTRLVDFDAVVQTFPRLEAPAAKREASGPMELACLIDFPKANSTWSKSPHYYFRFDG